MLQYAITAENLLVLSTVDTVLVLFGRVNTEALHLCDNLALRHNAARVRHMPPNLVSSHEVRTLQQQVNA